MTESATALPQGWQQQAAALAKPGVVFSEPQQFGAYTIITASAYRMRGERVRARPVGAIVIGPNGVEVRRFQRPEGVLFLVLLIVIVTLGTSLVILNPPWAPQRSLLDEVGKLIRTLREA